MKGKHSYAAWVNPFSRGASTLCWSSLLAILNKIYLICACRYTKTFNFCRNSLSLAVACSSSEKKVCHRNNAFLLSTLDCAVGSGHDMQSLWLETAIFKHWFYKTLNFFSWSAVGFEYQVKILLESIKTNKKHTLSHKTRYSTLIKHILGSYRNCAINLILHFPFY